VTHDLGWWLVGKPMVDFLFVLIELILLSITVPELWDKLCTAQLFSQGVDFFALNFNQSRHQKTRGTLRRAVKLHFNSFINSSTETRYQLCVKTQKSRHSKVVCQNLNTIRCKDQKHFDNQHTYKWLHCTKDLPVPDLVAQCSRTLVLGYSAGCAWPDGDSQCRIHSWPRHSLSV